MDTEKLLSDLDMVKIELSDMIARALICGMIPDRLEYVESMIDKIKASITEA